MPVRHATALALLVLVLACPARADEPADPDADLLAFLKTPTPFARDGYKPLRAAFARRFETKFADIIKEAFGDDGPAIRKWLDDNPDVRETLFTAFDESADKLGEGLAVFRELFRKHADKLTAYPELAIACCVVWDDLARGPYDYRGHQTRTHSKLPEEVASTGAVENFRFFVDNEKTMQGRGQLLPWEFLVYAVDHRTPLAERDWVTKNYLNRRAMAGGCYKDIAYDHTMLRTEQADGVAKSVCKLAGVDYSLPNIKKLGGVCAMQADFAARVGKSLGVPAVFVGGEGNTGVLHAWVMWVELKDVRKEKIVFTLESEGRYFGDRFYTGKATDPQTGEPVLDRDLELLLTSVGTNRASFRQARLLMRAFPLIKAQNPEVRTQLAYLDKVLAVEPRNADAWAAVAALSKDGSLGPADVPAVMARVDKLQKTFERFPDVCWRVFDDLLTAQKDRTVRTREYVRLVAQFEAAGRPDLACEARLKLTEYLEDSKEFEKAAKGLAYTIEKFPDEGRYVPKMMKRLQEICGNYKGGTAYLSKFYITVLNKVPPKRGNEPSQYCISMLEQAIAFFEENKDARTANALKAKLQSVRAGKP